MTQATADLSLVVRPASTGTAELGLYCTENAATVEALASTLGVTCQRMSVYCGGGNHTGLAGTFNTTMGLSVGVGDTTVAGATTTAQAIGAEQYAAGRRGTLYRVMWEQSTYFGGYSTSKYITAFQAVTTGIRAGDPSAIISYCPNQGGYSTLVNYYPGDAYVDVCQIDYYDTQWRTAGTDTAMLDFFLWAVARGKSTGLGEWGTWRGSLTNNNGSYITWMAGIINNPIYGVAYQELFSNKGDGSTDITAWPLAVAAYRAAFG